VVEEWRTGDRRKGIGDLGCGIKKEFRSQKLRRKCLNLKSCNPKSEFHNLPGEDP
jgi:hypothetical protein